MKSKLYVGNLSFSAEDAQLQAFFSAGGRNLVSAHVLVDRISGRSRGFGFVEYATPDEAQSAIEDFNGKEFMGRPLQVSEARDPAPRAPRNEEGGYGGGFSRGGGRGRRDSGY